MGQENARRVNRRFMGTGDVRGKNRGVSIGQGAFMEVYKRHSRL